MLSLKKLLNSVKDSDKFDENMFNNLYQRLEAAVKISNPDSSKLEILNKTELLYMETCKKLNLGCEKNTAMYTPLQKAKNALYEEMIPVQTGDKLLI